MGNEIDIYSPRYLAEVVRTTPPVHTFFKDSFFKNVKPFSTERIDIDIKKGDRRMAAFVHPKVGGEVLKENGYKTESYKPPLVNPYDITTADKLLKRLPGENIYSGRKPMDRAAEKLAEEYAALNDATTRREEWMAVQAIVNGSIPIVGKGVNEVIDFGLTNKATLSGTKKWDGTAAKPLDDLGDWTNHVLINGFANVDMAIMGKSALRAFLNNETVKERLDNRRIEIGQITPRDLPNGVKYIGHLNDPDLDIYTYSEVYFDDWTNPEKPETKPLIPDGAVILISSNASYMMAYGAVTYLDEKTDQWITEESSRVLRSFAQHKPDARILELMAHPLPIPDKADSWYVATVV